MRRLRCWPRWRFARLLAPCGGGGDGPDLISALPDDLLLLVLARLRCVAAAARTAVLSRRWRGLWSRLHQLVFRSVALPSVEAALSRVSPPPSAVSLLDIRVPDPKKHRRGCVPSNNNKHRTDAAGISSLLRAAARLDPEALSFSLNSLDLIDGPLDLDLPAGFRRATFIMLSLPFFIRCAPPAGAEFPALETLIMYQCSANLNALLSRCPRLRTLRLLAESCNMTVNSSSLRELGLCSWDLAEHVSIVAPMLKQLSVFFRAAANASVSVVAPLVETVSWKCSYSVVVPVTVFGVWRLEQVTLGTAEIPRLRIDACADQHSILHDDADSSRQEIEKHLVANFSVLELHLKTEGHDFGAFVIQLLGIDRIRCATRRLKVILHRSAMKGGCQPPCPCEAALNWTSQTISIPDLEEVEIYGFEGEIHFLKLILECAPMLKRITVKLSLDASASKDGCAKICNIFKAHSSSSVECDVYHYSDMETGWWSGQEEKLSIRFC